MRGRFFDSLASPFGRGGRAQRGRRGYVRIGRCRQAKSKAVPLWGKVARRKPWRRDCELKSLRFNEKQANTKHLQALRLVDSRVNAPPSVICRRQMTASPDGGRLLRCVTLSYLKKHGRAMRVPMGAAVIWKRNTAVLPAKTLPGRTGKIIAQTRCELKFFLHTFSFKKKYGEGRGTSRRRRRRRRWPGR